MLLHPYSPKASHYQRMKLQGLFMLKCFHSLQDQWHTTHCAQRSGILANQKEAIQERDLNHITRGNYPQETNGGAWKEGRVFYHHLRFKGLDTSGVSSGQPDIESSKRSYGHAGLNYLL